MGIRMPTYLILVGKWMGNDRRHFCYPDSRTMRTGGQVPPGGVQGRVGRVEREGEVANDTRGLLSIPFQGDMEA